MPYNDTLISPSITESKLCICNGFDIYTPVVYILPDTSVDILVPISEFSPPIVVAHCA